MTFPAVFYATGSVITAGAGVTAALIAAYRAGNAGDPRQIIQAEAQYDCKQRYL